MQNFAARHNVIIGIALLVVILATRLGGFYSFPPSSISVFWPPNAILLATLLLVGIQYQNRALLFAYPAFFFAEIWSGYKLSDALLFSFANCIEVLIAIKIISKCGSTRFDLSNIRQLLIILFAVVPASLVGGLIGAFAIWLSNGPFIGTYISWVLTDFVGYLVVTPLILTLPSWCAWIQSSSIKKKIQVVALFAGLLVVTVTVYGLLEYGPLGKHGLAFIPIPLMMYSAIRYGPKGATMSSLIVAVVSISFAINGLGPFISQNIVSDVRGLQIFITSIVFATLAIAVISKERDIALSKLKLIGKDLESSVEDKSKQLIVSQDRYEVLVESAPIGIYEISPKGELLSINNAAKKMLLLSDLTDVNVFEHWSSVGADYQSEILDLLADALNGKNTDSLAHNIGKHNKNYIETNFTPILSDSGEVIKVVGITHDVTARTKAEEKLRTSQKMDAIGQLTGGIAHDFNNLLSVMLGNLELLKMKSTNQDEGQSKHIEAIFRAASHGESLTKRLMAFSRHTILSSKPTDIGQTFIGLEVMLQRTISESIEVKFNSSSNLWFAMIDPHEFESALINLILNSRDAMPNGGIITVTAENTFLDEGFTRQHAEVNQGEYVKVMVADNGNGIPLDILDKVFEPFFTTKDFGMGSGLGLSMVFGFVKQSKGYITIDSDNGTVVSLFLPKAVSSVAESIISKNPERLKHKSEKILIVEDNADVLDVCQIILQTHGYKITVAINGKEAIDKLSNESFDLAFIDVILAGGISGVDVAKEAIRLQPQIKIIHTTGYAERSTEVLALDQAVNVIYKPYRRKQLLDIVRYVLDQ